MDYDKVSTFIIAIALCAVWHMSTGFKQQWAMLPRLTKLLVLILPFIGFALLVVGLRNDKSGWSAVHPFFNNTISGVMAFCFGVPTAIVVLQQLEEARQRRIIYHRTEQAWARLVAAVKAYVDQDRCDELASDAARLYRTANLVCMPRDGNIRPESIGAASDSATNTYKLWEQRLANDLDPKLWDQVVEGWNILDSQIRPKRTEIGLKWFNTAEYEDLKWAIEFGSFRKIAEDGVVAAKAITEYYSRLIVWCNAEAPAKAAAEARLTELRQALGAAPIELVDAWVQSSRRAVLQQRILTRAVENANPKEFNIEGELDRQYYEQQPYEEATPDGTRVIHSLRVPKGLISRS